MQPVLSDVYLGSLSLEETETETKVDLFQWSIIIFFYWVWQEFVSDEMLFYLSFLLLPVGDLEWEVYVMNLFWKESAPFFQSRRKYLTRCML